MRVLVTGAAGFIGFHTSKTLLEQGQSVVGYDNFNDYYDPRHKDRRAEILSSYDKFRMVRGDLEDAATLKAAWNEAQPEAVIHLAAQAGVRYSIENPMAYVKANVEGFQNVLDLVRDRRPQAFVYASSSSVYGGNKELPFSETQDVRNPVSLYAATKVANELFAKAYGNLFALPSVGLRFFTVYGPYARPDMAMYKFAELMRTGQKIPVYNGGNMVRDFTYVDDIVDGIIRCLKVTEPGKVYNLGRGAPMNLMDMIALLERHLGIEAKRDFLPMQLGDVPATVADVSLAGRELGYQPKTDLAVGVERFCTWYKALHNL